MGNKPTGSSTDAREPIVTERGYNPPPVAKVERPVPSPPAPRPSSPDPAPTNSRVRVRTGSGSPRAEDLFFGIHSRTESEVRGSRASSARSKRGPIRVLIKKTTPSQAKKVEARSGSGRTHVVEIARGETVEVVLGDINLEISMLTML